MIDNEFYKHLGEAWFTAEGDAVALLRQENLTKAPWVANRILAHVGPGARVLDVGCGGGFLSLDLSARGYRVTGLDVDEAVMAGGRLRDRANQVDWRVGTAEALPFGDHAFDVVCMMDVLEHVRDWRAAVTEATRVLAPGGVFIFHTFNRTARSWLFAARGLDWFIKDSPAHVHEWRMFIKPAELATHLAKINYQVREWSGIQPRIFSKAFAKLLVTRRVPKDFGFRIGGGLGVGYLGVAARRGTPDPRGR